MPERSVFVFGDRARLRQVLENLLSNALKFTSRGGHVQIAAEERGDSVRIRVKDDGRGIEPGQLAAVFEPFVQVRRDDATHAGGLGLGLALVQALVSMHDGAVHAESAGLGCGCEFVVTLPTTAAASAPPNGTEPPRQETATRKRVLIVEDNADARQTLADLLGALGHEAQVSADAESALSICRTVQPDLILCDLSLPGMDGYALAKHLRTEPTLSRTRLVALSGFGSQDDVRRAHDAGFDEHLTKPIGVAELQRLLQDLRVPPAHDPAASSPSA